MKTGTPGGFGILGAGVIRIATPLTSMVHHLHNIKSQRYVRLKSQITPTNNKPTTRTRNHELRQQLHNKASSHRPPSRRSRRPPQLLPLSTPTNLHLLPPIFPPLHANLLHLPRSFRRTQQHHHLGRHSPVSSLPRGENETPYRRSYDH